MLRRDSEDEMCSRFVPELVIWPQEVILARWTQPSGPLCLWQCYFNIEESSQFHSDMNVLFSLSKFGFNHLHFFFMPIHRVSEKVLFQKFQGLDRLDCFGILWTVSHHCNHFGQFWIILECCNDRKQTITFQNSSSGLKPKISEKYFFRHRACNMLTVH